MSENLIRQVDVVAVAAARLSTAAEDFRALSDSDLRRFAGSISGLRWCVAAQDALVAGEIARRSARALGGAGLAQKNGYRTPEEMVKVVTGEGVRLFV